MCKFVIFSINKVNNKLVRYQIYNDIPSVFKSLDDIKKHILAKNNDSKNKLKFILNEDENVHSALSYKEENESLKDITREINDTLEVFSAQLNELEFRIDEKIKGEINND